MLLGVYIVSKKFFESKGTSCWGNGLFLLHLGCYIAVWKFVSGKCRLHFCTRYSVFTRLKFVQTITLWLLTKPRIKVGQIISRITLNFVQHIQCLLELVVDLHKIQSHLLYNCLNENSNQLLLFHEISTLIIELLS